MQIPSAFIIMGLKEASRSLSEFYRTAENTEKIVMTSAISAAGIDAVAGFIPGIAIPFTIVECFGVVWVMYGLICKELGISLKKNVLKLLARAALANISANLVCALGALIAGMFIPGGSIIASAIVAFITIYIAGVIFLNLVLKLVKKGYDPYTFAGVSEKEMKSIVKDMKVGKDTLDEAKDAYDAYEKSNQSNESDK